MTTCGRCDEEILWDGKRWIPTADPLEPCLVGLGREHRPSDLPEQCPHGVTETDVVKCRDCIRERARG